MTPHDDRARARSGRRRTLRVAAVTAALATAALIGPMATSATALPLPAPTAETSAVEHDLASRISGVRWLSGRSPLPFDTTLGAQASAWSGVMAWIGQLAHHPNLSLEASRAASSWSGYGEIVGRGHDVGSVMQAFMASPPHRGKIMGDWRALGVGIVESNGQLWVTVRFIR